MRGEASKWICNILDPCNQSYGHQSTSTPTPTHWYNRGSTRFTHFFPAKQYPINRDRQHMKAWTAVNRLSVIWKSDQTDKMKRSFFQAVVVSILLYRCTRLMLTKCMEKNLTATTQECCEQYWTNPGAAPHKAAAVQPPTIHHENYQN